MVKKNETSGRRIENNRNVVVVVEGKQLKCGGYGGGGGEGGKQ